LSEFSLVHPILYEINTRCWLRELSQQRAEPITLANVPDAEFVRWQSLGFTHIWLMGVWSSGPRAQAHALADPGLRKSYSEALPDWQLEDVGGSPYAISAYEIPHALGGEAGLEQFREQLKAHGMRLVLDFVPNHVGLDHPRVQSQPELFVQSPSERAETFAVSTQSGIRWLAHGKDPYFPVWKDTVQLDYRSSVTRAGMIETLKWIAERCDGVRCDMAMLLLNEIFAKTWVQFPNSSEDIPNTEFWAEAIGAVKQQRPDFLFLAEAYWGLERRLQELGFDYTYDKELYDRVVDRDAPGVQRHLRNSSFVEASTHFLENHDEPRIASRLSSAEQRAAALLVLSLPGMRFLHEGQLAGARVRSPVQLLRRAVEEKDRVAEEMYEQILKTLGGSAVGRGKAELLERRAAWAENPTAENFVLVQWQLQPPGFDLVVINLAPYRSQCYVALKVQGLANCKWMMRDLLGEEQYVRAGNELEPRGLYLDVAEHGAQLFHFEPSA
jgi:hypothetical protein